MLYLSIYLQNHRKYVKSRDHAQLLGNMDIAMSENCNPLSYDKNNKPIFPCGTTANSLFNGEYVLISMYTNVEYSVDTFRYISSV